MEFYLNNYGIFFLKEDNKFCEQINNSIYTYFHKYKRYLGKEDLNQEIVLIITEFFKEKCLNSSEQLNKNHCRMINSKLNKTLPIVVNSKDTFSHVIKVDGKLERVYVKHNFFNLDNLISDRGDKNFLNELTTEEKEYFYLYKLSHIRMFLTEKNNEFLTDYLNNNLEHYTDKKIKQNITYIKSVIKKNNDKIMKENFTIRYRQMLKSKKNLLNFLKTWDKDKKKLEDYILTDNFLYNNVDIFGNINIEIELFIKKVDNYDNKYNSNIKKDKNLNEEIRRLKDLEPEKRFFNINANGIFV